MSEKIAELEFPTEDVLTWAPADAPDASTINQIIGDIAMHMPGAPPDDDSWDTYEVIVSGDTVTVLFWKY